MGHAPLVLRVPIANFGAELRERLGEASVYVARTADGRARVTAADPATGLVLTACGDALPAVRDALARQGLTARDGGWDVPDEPVDGPGTEPVYISAVAYRSADGNASVWVDVDQVEPFEGEILRRMYDEFIETGELRNVDYDAFLKAGEPTCVIVDPEQVRFYLRQKLAGPAEASKV